MRGILIKFPEEMIAEIDERAKEVGVSRSEWVRDSAASRLLGRPVSIKEAHGPVNLSGFTSACFHADAISKDKGRYCGACHAYVGNPK